MIDERKNRNRDGITTLKIDRKKQADVDSLYEMHIKDVKRKKKELQNAMIKKRLTMNLDTDDPVYVRPSSNDQYLASTESEESSADEYTKIIKLDNTKKRKFLRLIRNMVK